jgi:hypothetical protein
MENTLSSKMAEFMTALDQVKKYRTLVASMTDFVLILLGTVVAALSVNISMRLFTLFIGRNDGLSIVTSFLFFLIFPAGIIIAILWVRRKMKSVKIGQWKGTLSEGAPGAIELLQSLEWERIFSDIRYAKLGFFLYGIAKILAYWGLTSVFLFMLSVGVEAVFHMNVDYVIVLLFSLAIVLLLSRNDLRKRYDRMWRLDWLLWELRWFESEFRDANFEA